MKKTIMLGDSITEWNPMEKENVINMGIAGDTTRDIFWRIENVKSIEAEKVILMAGVNDIFMGFPLEKTCDFYKKIVSSLSENFQEIILLAVLPTEEERVNVKIEQMNRCIEGLAKENSLMFFDFSKMFFDNDGSLNSYFYADGVHLSSKGYEVLNKEIIRIL
jgi:lysophospholipase L1-like esterase